MTDLDYALDYLSKHPLEPAPWDAPPCECASCGWGTRATERCTLCRCEDERPAQLARDLIGPALVWCREKICPGLLDAGSSGEALTRPVIPGEEAEPGNRSKALAGAPLGKQTPTEKHQQPTVRAPSPIAVETPSDAYAVIERIGSLAGCVCLGMLAPLAALLGAVS